MEKKDIKRIMKSKPFIISGIIVVLLGAFIIYSISINSKVKAWDEKAYPGVSINGIDFNGKNKDEIIQVLNNEFIPKINNKVINVKVGENELAYKYSDLGPTFNGEELAEEIIACGKDSTIFEKNKFINNKKQVDYNLDLELLISDEKIVNLQNSIKKAVDIAPVKATISKNGQGFAITDEKVGYELNTENFNEKVKEALSSTFDGETKLEFTLVEVQASVKKSDLQKISGKMSSFTTNFASSTEDRAYNVQYVTSLLNGTVLMPGEMFSYDELSQRGKGKYKVGTMYINNKVVPAEAGGVCQVSSTLYNAAMMANIRSYERKNHSLPVGYVSPGLDATMAWGGVDYKFKNPYDFPIYIEGYVANKNVTINIYGMTEALGGNTYRLVSEDLGPIKQEVVYKNDPTLPQGTEVIEEKGAEGRKARAYLITYKNGVQIKRELVSTDTYAPQKTIIKRGTGPAATPAQ